MSLRSEDVIATHSSPPCGTGERLRRLLSVRICAPPHSLCAELGGIRGHTVSTCKEVKPWPFRNSPGWALTLLSSFGECKNRENARLISLCADEPRVSADQYLAWR